jgi:GPI-anchor transamidase subunit U
MLALALASYLSLYPVLLLPPLLLICYDRRTKTKSTAQANGKASSATDSGPAPKQAQTVAPNALTFAATQSVFFVVAALALLVLSYTLTSSWSFLRAHYLHIILLPSLTPNVGLWWYFFTEMFDSFRSFFLGVFWLHMFAYMPALSIRLRAQPLFVACALLGVVSIYAPYPAVG